MVKKGTGPVRSKKQREADFVRLAELYVRGWTQARIGQELGVSQASISNDLRELHRRWRESTTLSIDDYKLKELAKFDEVEREAWDAWTRSIQGQEKKMQRRGVTAGGEVDIREQIMTGAAGDARYLDTVLKCIDRRCKLLGLDAPQKVDASVHRDPLEAKSEEEVAGMMRLVLQEFTGADESEGHE